jgi:hypothetical protein
MAKDSIKIYAKSFDLSCEHLPQLEQFQTFLYYFGISGVWSFVH